MKSVAAAELVVIAAEALLVDRLGRLSADRMDEVCAALAVAVDCRT